MRVLILAVVSLLIPSLSIAQAPKKLPAAPKINDAFAKASLLALKAISSDSSPLRTENGAILVDRRVSALIDAADVEAISSQEKTVSTLLSGLLLQKETDNTNLEAIGLRIEASFFDKLGRAPLGFEKSEAIGRDPEAIQIRKNQVECFAALDSSLRDRSAEIPPTCRK